MNLKSLFSFIQQHLWHSCDGVDGRNPELKCLSFVFSSSLRDLICLVTVLQVLSSHSPPSVPCTGPGVGSGCVGCTASTSSFARDIHNLKRCDFLLSLVMASAASRTSKGACLPALPWLVFLDVWVRWGRAPFPAPPCSSGPHDFVLPGSSCSPFPSCSSLLRPGTSVFQKYYWMLLTVLLHILHPFFKQSEIRPLLYGDA